MNKEYIKSSISYKIIVCPLKRLYQCAEDGDMTDVAVLAVSSYDINQEKLKAFKKKLCLNFDDVTNGLDSCVFSNIIAEQVAKYIVELPKDTDTLFVCCDSGESRSTAMAAAILRYNGSDEMKIWENPHYHPNPLVYKLLCIALAIKVTEDEVADRLRISELAFAKSINNF